jgi:hypothetical protein
MNLSPARLRAKFKYGARAVKAAEEMRRHVVQGKAFEIPAAMSTDDVTTKAVLCLQELYPDIPVIYQSRGIIVGLVERTMKVSKEAWAQLKGSGYFSPAEAAGRAEAFLDRHTQFINRNEQNVDENVKEAQRRQAVRDAIVVSGTQLADGTPVKVTAAERPVAMADGRSFADVEAENDKARKAEVAKVTGMELKP